MVNKNLIQATAFGEIFKKEKDSFEIIDIRNEDSFEYGHITGAINIPMLSIFENLNKLSKDKKYYLYCRNGKSSAEISSK